MTRRLHVWLTWLERHWLAPAYSGGVLLGLMVAFFGAAVNTMAGWLYAISGIMAAIALISLWLAPRNFQGIHLHRDPIRPVSVGDPLQISLVLENTTAQAKGLLEVQDGVPAQLGQVSKTAIAAMPAHGQHPWSYTCRPTRRGSYQWNTVSLRTAVPLGLFWCQRLKPAPAHAIVYPQILPLQRCPLIDQLGMKGGQRWQLHRQSQPANTGLTRALRPYRWGDPTRLIHWRTSARYGDLRVRELEQVTADNQVLIALDAQSDRWTEASFESAVVAAASLYIYSLRRQLAVALWLPRTGTLQQKHRVLSALATVMPQPQNRGQRLPSQALLWLSPVGAPPQLPTGSLWLRWADADTATAPPGITITPTSSLLEQLQQDMTARSRS